MPERSDAEPAVGGRERLRLVQVLRAVAALMVVAHHATILLEERMRAPNSIWLGGTAGVDLFFVISGFVMMLTSARMGRGVRAGGRFFVRRLERVAPLYWIVTTVKLVTMLLIPALAIHVLGTVWHVVASYLFVPSLGPTGTMEPLVVVGWTLNLEMMFYVLVALALLFRAPVVAVVGAALVALTGLGFVSRLPSAVLHTWASPIVLEFCFGMLLAKAMRAGRLPGRWGSGVLLGAGWFVLLATPWAMVSAWRALVWGIPAAAVLAGALGLERTLGPRAPRWALEMGNASYSIYLSHGFVLPLVGVLLLRAELHAAVLKSAAIALSLLLSALVGELVYRAVELPMMLRFGRWRSVRALRAAA